ncbi:MAG: response regulator [Rhodocyclaceae bacterium]|nr:response regulator [Rhodocyclaceae bacterium]
MTPYHLLVVDDEPMNLIIIREFLDDPAYRLDCLTSGAAAWEKLRAGERYDLAILDWMMPGMDGLELLRRIRADARHAAMPVVMQTAAASPEQVGAAVAAGANQYLTKPFDSATLVAVVAAALAARQRRDLPPTV